MLFAVAQEALNNVVLVIATASALSANWWGGTLHSSGRNGGACSRVGMTACGFDPQALVPDPSFRGESKECPRGAD